MENEKALNVTSILHLVGDARVLSYILVCGNIILTITDHIARTRLCKYVHRSRCHAVFPKKIKSKTLKLTFPSIIFSQYQYQSLKIVSRNWTKFRRLRSFPSRSESCERKENEGRKRKKNNSRGLTSAPIIKRKLDGKSGRQIVEEAREIIVIEGIKRGTGTRKCRTGTLSGIARAVIPSRKLERRQS